MSEIVVIATDTFAPDHNGTANFSKRLAVALQLQGVEVHVIAPATSRLYGTFREKHDGVPIIVHRLKSYRMPFQPTARFVMPGGLTKRIRGLLEQIKPNVVHIQSHINVGHHAAMAAKELSLRLIATNHLDVESLVENTLLLPTFLKNYIRRALIADSGRVMRLADAVITSSAKAKSLLERITGKADIQVISGGVNLALYRPAVAKKSLEHRLLYVGRLDREKHVFTLLQAMALLPKDLKVKLKVIGSGSQLEELGSLARKLEIEKLVSFESDLEDYEVIDELKQATAFVMTSPQELQSLATLEALASGLPVIAANAMALPEIIQDGVNGFLFEPDSPADLANSVQKIFKLNSREYGRISKQALASASKHDFAITVESYMGLYFGKLTQLPQKDLKPILGSITLSRAANGVLERLDGARGQVIETFMDVKFSVGNTTKKAKKKLSASFRRALGQTHRDD